MENRKRNIQMKFYVTEEEKRLIDDTAQYAIQGMHIHLTDFILRPVEFRHVVRSMKLALERF